MFDLSPLPFPDSAFDMASFCAIIGILLLSLTSLGFVFHLRLKSRASPYLESFNSLWIVRFLLVSFITFWAVNELIRVPFFRQRYLYPFVPSLTLLQQANLCKINVVLSLGLFEPGFLVTLLFLVHVSIKKTTPRGTWAIVFVSATCFPVLCSQVLVVFVSKIGVLQVPESFRRTSVVLRSNFGGEERVLCTYPLMSSILFGAFGIWFSVGFSLSCLKVVTLVINKGLRVRTYALALAVMITLPLEIVFLIFSSFSRPGETLYFPFGFLVLLTTLIIAAVGEGILVIAPVADSLAVGGESCPLFLNDRSQLADQHHSIQV